MGRWAGRKEGGARKAERSVACMNEEEEEACETASFQGSLSYTRLGTVDGVLLALL